MRLGGATVIALVAISCRTPAPSGKHSLPAGEDSGAPAPSVSAASAPSALPPWLGEGCAEGIDPNGSDAELLERLTRACAPGMKRHGEPARVTADGGPLEVRFPLSAAACVRVAAVSSNRQSRLELELLDTEGNQRGRELARGPVALVGPRGPVCVEKSGELRVLVRGASSALVAFLVAD